MGDDGTQPRQRRLESTQPSLKSIPEEVSVNIENIDTDSEEDKDELYEKKKNKVSGHFTLISVAVLIIVTLLFVKYMDRRLPNPLMESDINDNPTSFIEQRSREDLSAVSDGIGVRVTGSIATDIHTVRLLLEMIQGIKDNATQIGVYNVEAEEQRPSGSFWLDDDEGSTSSYHKIANVVAKLEPLDPSQRTNNAILLNCHFDSKPGSPGATDNMISCAVMLEIMRVLSSQKELIVRNTIVFLFNGAEELGLQGAHGFVKGKTDSSQSELGHRWSKNVKAFINLEGAGGGGREILFQATGGDLDETEWLLKAYKEGPYPYGTVLAEEAFQFGLIPSDTDFRIFRDYGGIPGMDIAYIKNGWVYHTKWDTVAEIPPGSLQHMGANALAMTKYLGTIDLSKKQDSAGEVVFFDVLGAFMITYSKTVGIVINILVALASLAVIIYFVGYKPTWKNLLTYLLYFGSTVIAWGASVGVAAIVAIFLQGSGYPKPFYSYPSLAAILFGIPAFITQILVYSFCLKSSPKDAWLAGKFTMSIILIVATIITRAAYMFAIPLIFGIVGWFAARYLMRGWPRAIMITYLIIGELIPLMMSSYLIVTLADVFVPILGRSGSETNGNLFFGLIISALLTIHTLNGLAALFVNYDRKTLITLLLGSILLLNPMIVFGFLGKIPYMEKTPMRLTICDVERIWYDGNDAISKSERGYWWWPIDGDTDNLFPEFSKTVYEIDDIRDEELDYPNCDSLYCSQPFIWPTTSRIKKTHWITKTTGLDQNLVDKVRMVKIPLSSTPTSRQFRLEFHGPVQMNVVLSPNSDWDAKITIDVLGSSVGIEKEGNNLWKGRKVYYIYHGRGCALDPLDPLGCLDEPLIVNVDLQKKGDGGGGGGGNGDGSLLDIQHTGLYLDFTVDTTTPTYRNFLSKFPSWTFTGMSWSSVVKMYKVI